jgi:hypothetical protein
MPRNLKTQAQLHAKINQLEQEITHLRTLLKVILDTAYLAVNGRKTKEEKPPQLCSCYGCQKLISRAKDGGKYEVETGRYWCSSCVRKESHE